MHHCFSPDADRTKALDNTMQTGLADSLEHICEQCDGKLSFDEIGITRIIKNLRTQQRYPPSTFGIYHELAKALLNDQTRLAEDLFREIIEENPLDNGLSVLALGDSEIQSHTSRFQRMMNCDPNFHFDFLPPPEKMAMQFKAQIESGFALIERTIPELAAEIQALISQVLIAVGKHDVDAEFDGGSSYSLWGALFLNASSHNNDIAMVEVITHETAHCLLNGLSIEESLVLNPDDEYFPSPLRSDLRPMDGIYHATFVSARMHWAMSRLIESGQLDAHECETAEQARIADQKNFNAGYESIATHALLTATGEQVIANAKKYMDAI